ncbi:MAG: hypothetical protein VX533_01900, partial [Pseudomonadota bacterium]|nr:hypothetical protein [Pseudomonadota bacterium]
MGAKDGDTRLGRCAVNPGPGLYRLFSNGSIAQRDLGDYRRPAYYLFPWSLTRRTSSELTGGNRTGAPPTNSGA